MDRTIKHDQERKIRGTVGKQNKYTVGQINELADNRLKETVQQLAKKRYMVDLQRQIQDKKIREETQRVFMDPKQMATSSKLMEKVNPELFEAKVGDTQALLKNENIMDKECQEMSKIELSKLFMPN
jgi:serine/threonine protein phosphatase PrpC